jgi:hypothetical protein
MRPRRLVGLWLLGWSVGLGGSWTFAGDSPAEQALKAKGLTKVARVFSDPEAERPVLEKFKDARPVLAAYAAAAEKQAMAEQIPMAVAQLEQERQALQANLNMLNRQASTQTSGRYGRMARAMGPTPAQIEQQQVSATIKQVTANENALKSKIPSAKDKAAIDGQAREKAEALRATLAELRTMVDDVKKKYDDLHADASVKKSLVELEKSTHATLTIGPSALLAAGIKDLEHAERQFLGKKPATASSASHAKKKATTAQEKAGK